MTIAQAEKNRNDAHKQDQRINAPLSCNRRVIERRIYLIRGEKVMLDADLGEIYEGPTKVLNQAVGRNARRFPEDFMFQLTAEEAESLRPRRKSRAVRSDLRLVSNVSELRSLPRVQVKRIS